MEPTPTIPSTVVPWDPAELKGRTCQNCACYFESANPQDPSKFQGFCRRSPATLTQLRTEVPRLDLQKRPVMRDGKPVMNSEVVAGFIYQLTQRDGTCFDGYRTKGTLPGELPTQAMLRTLGPVLLKVAKQATKLPPELEQAMREAFEVAPAIDQH